MANFVCPEFLFQSTMLCFFPIETLLLIKFSNLASSQICKTYAFQNIECFFKKIVAKENKNKRDYAKQLMCILNYKTGIGLAKIVL